MQLQILTRWCHLQKAKEMDHTVGRPAEDQVGGAERDICRSAYEFDMRDIRDQTISIQQHSLVVAVGAGDDILAAVRANMQKPTRPIVTNGDGACAIHSVFGRPGANRELFASRARILAAFLLGDSLERLWEDGAAQQHVAEIEASLWYEFALPYLRGSPSSEGQCFGVFWSESDQNSWRKRP